jgi:hypothetical protein
MIGLPRYQFRQLFEERDISLVVLLVLVDDPWWSCGGLGAMR